MLYIYIHGFNSGYSPEGYKVAALKKIGMVDGVQYDSFSPYDIVYKSIQHQICDILKPDGDLPGFSVRSESPEGVRTQSVACDRSDSASSQMVISIAGDKAGTCLVGTSLGGFWASLFGNRLGIPAVLINPTIKPYISLKRYVGRRLPNFVTREKNRLDAGVPGTYTDIETSGDFLVLLDAGDQVLDYRAALDWFQGKNVHCFEGGSHRFDHMEESLPLIKKFAENFPYFTTTMRRTSVSCPLQSLYKYMPLASPDASKDT